MENFKVIIVEDVPLELKGTEGIFKTDIPEAEIIGTAENEPAYWRLIKAQKPDLVLLDLGLGGSTTIGVEICRSTKQQYPDVKVLIFTGEILNEKLWEPCCPEPLCPPCDIAAPVEEADISAGADDAPPHRLPFSFSTSS